MGQAMSPTAEPQAAHVPYSLLPPVQPPVCCGA